MDMAADGAACGVVQRGAAAAGCWRTANAAGGGENRRDEAEARSCAVAGETRRRREPWSPSTRGAVA